jgi:ribonuclease P protein component
MREPPTGVAGGAQTDEIATLRMRRGAKDAVGQRRGRLSRSADFDRVFRHGRSHASRELVLYVFPRDDVEASPRLGLTVSRKVGGAVERNRVKRLLREAFAREAARLPSGTDVVIVARPDAKSLAEREGLEGLHRSLAELVDRARGMSGKRASATEGEAR